MNLWLLVLPLCFCGALGSSYFRKLLSTVHESVTCVNVRKDIEYQGESAEEKRLHQQALRRSSAGFLLILAVLTGRGLHFAGTDSGRTLLEASLQEMQASSWRVLFYIAASASMLRGLIAECVEKPQAGNGNMAVIVRCLGFPAYWTVQTLTLCFIIFCFSALGEATIAAGQMPPSGAVPAILVAAPHQFSIFATTQAVMVTILYTATMWGNDAWREKHVLELERQGLPAGLYGALSHFLLPIAVLDLLLVRRPYVVRSLGLNMSGCICFGTAYALIFAAFILFTKAMTGHIQYTVIEKLITWQKYPMVVLGIIVLQCTFTTALWLAVEYTG